MIIHIENFKKIAIIALSITAGAGLILLFQSNKIMSVHLQANPVDKACSFNYSIESRNRWQEHGSFSDGKGRLGCNESLEAAEDFYILCYCSD